MAPAADGRKEEFGCCCCCRRRCSPAAANGDRGCERENERWTCGFTGPGDASGEDPRGDAP